MPVSAAYQRKKPLTELEADERLFNQLRRMVYTAIEQNEERGYDDAATAIARELWDQGYRQDTTKRKETDEEEATDDRAPGAEEPASLP